MKVNKNTNTGEKKYYVGIDEFVPMIVNPTRQQLDKLLEITRGEDEPEKEEFTYLKENKTLKVVQDGEETEITANELTVTVWGKCVKTDKIFPLNFRLYDVVDSSKTGKFKFVNQHGKSIYCDSEENLQDWFRNTPGKNGKALEYKVAKKGEADLMEFLAAYTNINPFDAESTLFFENEKRFWKGDMRELNSLISSFEGSSAMVALTLREREVSNEQGETDIKVYNTISTKAFCSGTYMKFFRNYERNKFEGLAKNAKVNGFSMYPLFMFVENLFSGEYAIKDVCFKGEVVEYNESMNPANTESAIVNDDPGY